MEAMQRDFDALSKWRSREQQEFNRATFATREARDDRLRELSDEYERRRADLFERHNVEAVDEAAESPPVDVDLTAYIQGHVAAICGQPTHDGSPIDTPATDLSIVAPTAEQLGLRTPQTVRELAGALAMTGTAWRRCARAADGYGVLETRCRAEFRKFTAATLLRLAATVAVERGLVAGDIEGMTTGDFAAMLAGASADDDRRQGESLPDGPHEPTGFWHSGRAYELRGIRFHLLRSLWGPRRLSIADAIDEVWQGSRVADKTVSNAASSLGTWFAENRLPYTCNARDGYVWLNEAPAGR